MSDELYDLLKKVKPEEDHEFLNGKGQTRIDLNKIDENIKNAIPEWVRILLLDFEMAELLIEFNSIESERKSIRFNSFKQIEEACLNFYPGCAIFKLGYLPIGEDPTGSGDPYFVNLLEGSNPPVYQIYHDVSDRGEEIIRDGKELVSSSFSEMLKNQIK